jgi:hypothetical protein
MAARTCGIRVGDATWNARLECCNSSDLAPAVMTCAAVEALMICFRVYAGGVRLHCETNVGVAHTARELCAVQPVFENNRRVVCRDVLVQRHVSKLILSRDCIEIYLLRLASNDSKEGKESKRQYKE